jgi:Zn-dependent protease
MDLLLNPIVTLVISLIILIYSAILHEIAHGFVAERLGDPTARLLGRLTLDPRPHIDPIMSVIVPLLLLLSGSPVIFGGAKPVPVDPFNLKEGRKDIALVSLAGPLTNILLAVIATVLFHLLAPSVLLDSSTVSATSILTYFLGIIIRLNVLLAIFNLLPIPPLDGSKIFALLLPEKAAAQYLAIGNLGAGLILLLLLLPTGIQTILFGLYSFSLRLLGF